MIKRLNFLNNYWDEFNSDLSKITKEKVILSGVFVFGTNLFATLLIGLTFSNPFWRITALAFFNSLFLLGVLYYFYRKNNTKEALRIQTQNSAKLAAIVEMAGGVAHEINNPLAIIYAKATLLKKMALAHEGKLDIPKLIDGIEKIETTTERINRIIKGLRTISRDTNEDAFETVSLGSIISDTTELCKYRLNNRDIKFVFPQNAASPPEGSLLSTSIECRPAQVVQILLNLISNSFDAVLDLPSRWIELGLSDQDPYIEFYVKDCGTGIPSEISDKIMDPFFTTKEVGKGTGLGLSTAHSMAKAHQGELYLDKNCPNTRFVVKIKKIRSISKKNSNSNNNSKPVAA